MARCPKCRSQLPPGAAVGEVAQCRICAHIFELEDPDAEPDPSPAPEPVVARRAEPRVAERPPAVEPEPPPELPDVPAGRRKQVPLPTPPYTIEATAFPNGVALDLSWKEDVGALGRLVFAGMAFASVVSLFAGQMGASVDGPSLIGFVGHGLITLMLMSASAYVELNKTTVLVAAGGIEVSHGPLPWPFGSKRIGARKLKILTVTAKETRSRRGHRVIRYQLDANGVVGPVLKNWAKRETLDYVQLAIERVTQP